MTGLEIPGRPEIRRPVLAGVECPDKNNYK